MKRDCADMPVKKRVAIQTLGCRANQADSTYIAGMLCQRGYEVVGTNEMADYYILNTCTVTGKADQEARQLARRAKRRNPAVKVVVTGCYAQTQPEAVAALKGVDCVIGNVEKGEIANLLPTTVAPGPVDSASLCQGPGLKARSAKRMPRATRRNHINATNIFEQKEVPSFGLSSYSKNTRAFVKIQDGCNRFCSFCIVPYARGKSRSVPMDSVLKELHSLHTQGFEEAILTGIHLGTYGEERGQSLLQLLQLINREKPLPRIRLSSIDPEELSDPLIDCVAESDVLCPHFHIPVQSGDDTILKRMKRRYEVERFRQVVEKIISILPDANLGTDILVGFPGESEEHFMATYRMVEELPLSTIHVFPYSKRKGTSAARLGGHIPSYLKKDRVRKFLSLAKIKKRRFFQRFLACEMEVLVEEKRDRKEGLLKGVTPNYIPVHFSGGNYLYRKRIRVNIERVDQTRVYGVIENGGCVWKTPTPPKPPTAKTGRAGFSPSDQREREGEAPAALPTEGAT